MKAGKTVSMEPTTWVVLEKYMASQNLDKINDTIETLLLSHPEIKKVNTK